MCLTIEDWKNIAQAVQSAATVVSFLVGGIWVYRKYIMQQEGFASIESSADIQFVGAQDDFWIAELTLTLENKGKAQHRMTKCAFDLNAIEDGEPIVANDRWGGQVDFSTPLTEGSFLPNRYKFFFIAPGVTAKYSYITRIPASARYVILHCWFDYDDGRPYSHTAERTVAVPAVEPSRKRPVRKTADKAAT